MNQSITDIYRFFFSHDFTIGVQKAVGIFLPVFILYCFNVELQYLMTTGYASLTIGIADQTGPYKHKRNELLITLCGCVFIAFIFVQFDRFSYFLIICLSLVIFISNFISCFGPKVSTIGFTFIFIALIAGRTEYNALYFLGFFSFGAFFYFFYALIFARVFSNYITRQNLSGAYFHLSTYLKALSECYRQNSDLEESFQALIESQTTLLTELQLMRDLLYRSALKEDPQILRMASELSTLIDMHERLVSPLQDFKIIRKHFANTDLQIFFRDVFTKAGNNLEEMGMYTLGGGEMLRRLGFKAELRALEYELELIKKAAPDSEKLEAYQILIAHYRKSWVLSRQLDKIRTILINEAEPDKFYDYFTKFVSHNYWSLDILKEHLTLKSDIMRYAIRSSVAMSFTLVLIKVIMEESTVLGHGFWIAFTLITLMRPGFSITRDRSRNRLKGTVLGCILGGILVSLQLEPLTLAFLLFLSVVLSNGLSSIKYELSVMFTTVYVLILLNVDDRLTGLAIAAERILDTGLASVIAILFTVYFLPSWEKEEAPRLVKKIKENIFATLATIEAIWVNKTEEEYEFQLILKNTQASIVELSNCINRMQKEPEKFHGNFHELNDFLVRQQSMLSQLSMLGYSLAQAKKDPNDIPEFNELLALMKLRMDPNISEDPTTKPYTAQEVKPLIWMVEAA